MKDYLVVGDAEGFIRIFDLSGFFHYFEIEAASQANIKSNYNIMKKDDINVEAILNHYLIKERKAFDDFYDINPNLLTKEIRAHDDGIMSFFLVEEPFCIATCSKDKTFKVFSINLECIGQVVIQPNQELRLDTVSWKFEINWDKLKKNEMREVIDIFEQVGGESTKHDDDYYKEEKTEKKLDAVVKQSKKIKKVERKTRYRPIDYAKKINTYEKTAGKSETKIEVI